jgi:hypothetical protein
MAIWRRVVCWINQATRAQAHARALHSHPHARTRSHSRAHKTAYKLVTLIAFSTVS